MMTQDKPTDRTDPKPHIAMIMTQYERVELDHLPQSGLARVILIPTDQEQSSRTMFTGSADAAALVLARLAVRYPHLTTNLPKPTGRKRSR